MCDAPVIGPAVMAKAQEVCKIELRRELGRFGEPLDWEGPGSPVLLAHETLSASSLRWLLGMVVTLVGRLQKSTILYEINGAQVRSLLAYE